MKISKIPGLSFTIVSISATTVGICLMPVIGLGPIALGLLAIGFFLGIAGIVRLVEEGKE